MTASNSKSTTGKSKAVWALPLSIFLHVGVIYAVSRVGWIVPESVAHVELSLVYRVEPLSIPPPDVFPVETVEPESEPEPIDEIQDPPIREAREPPSVPEPLPNAPASADELLPDAESMADDESEDAGEASYLQPGVDWDRELRQAAAMVIERQSRVRNYSTFSLEDFDEEVIPAEPGFTEDIFDAPRGPSSVFQTGQQKTKVGRWLADICNDLSGGGIGIGFAGFGFAACADPDEPADFFGFMRPDYMEKMPFCQEVDAPSPFSGTSRVADAAPTIKCVLVYPNEYGLAVDPNIPIPEVSN